MRFLCKRQVQVDPLSTLESGIAPLREEVQSIMRVALRVLEEECLPYRTDGEPGQWPLSHKRGLQPT
jgi:hypothetical protein